MCPQDGTNVQKGNRHVVRWHCIANAKLLCFELSPPECGTLGAELVAMYGAPLRDNVRFGELLGTHVDLRRIFEIVMFQNCKPQIDANVYCFKEIPTCSEPDLFEIMIVLK